MKQPGTIRVVIGPPISANGRDVREINREYKPGRVTVQRLVSQLEPAVSTPD